MTTGIAGKKIVLAVYGSAVLLCALLLWHGLDWRREHAVSPPLPEEDRAVLAQLPREWVRITKIEGNGWVRFAGCTAPDGETGSLVIEAGEASPRLLCAFCDSIEEATVRRVRLKGQPVKVRMRLGADGEAWVEPVDADVAARFGDAPVRDYVLTWTLPGGAAMTFVPAERAEDFELLRAADENPEGCGGR